MTVYSASQARDQLPEVLDEAERDGTVRIRREDGREFDVTPTRASPFDIEDAGVDLTLGDILEAIHQGRERT